eukprot:9094312-Pyramimonas_sp.AAC.1
MAIARVREADGEEKQRLQFKVLMRGSGTADLFTRASQGRSSLYCTTILPGDRPRAPTLPFTAHGGQPPRASCG